MGAAGSSDEVRGASKAGEWAECVREELCSFGTVCCIDLAQACQRSSLWWRAREGDDAEDEAALARRRVRETGSRLFCTG